MIGPVAILLSASQQALWRQLCQGLLGMLSYERLAASQTLCKPKEHVGNSSCACVYATPLDAFARVHPPFNHLSQQIPVEALRKVAPSLFAGLQSVHCIPRWCMVLRDWVSVTCLQSVIGGMAQGLDQAGLCVYVIATVHQIVPEKCGSFGLRHVFSDCSYVKRRLFRDSTMTVRPSRTEA